MKNSNYLLSAVALAVCMLSAGTCYGQGGEEKTPEVKNVIFMIGDGMGLAHVAATTIANNYEPLQLERAQFVGLSKTYSANNRVTDSAAGGTALATGVKTYNGAVGVDTAKQAVRSILEKAEDNGKATGMVVTCSVTNATPATFIAHVESRKMEEEIAEYYLKTDIDVFMGGGVKFFKDRSDNRDLTKELESKGYTIVYTLDDLLSFKDDRLGALLAENAMPKMSEGRGDYLPLATGKALELLKHNSPKGFFLMVEGSMIDGGGHKNDAVMVIDETLDFDKAVGAAFDFADNNPGTLVVVTADHETGGLSLPSGKPDFSLPDQGVKFAFSTGGHTGIFVPIYAYGAGAEYFSRILENTDIPKIMERLTGWK
ncbi:MAG: alkaline phosphatase [Dysgonamonadaceae bacterium]|jgi:alkaline phosphatase|nr:alkaline phosphatase [Dysgonamonadaceae bacterium]